MELKILDGKFCICKLRKENMQNLDKIEYCFFAKTDGELSLVCLSDDVPNQADKVDRNWLAMRIVGQLDFSLVGVLAKIANILAEEKIPIYVVSTFDTDYIFIKEDNFSMAEIALKNHGYRFAE